MSWRKVADAREGGKKGAEANLSTCSPLVPMHRANLLLANLHSGQEGIGHKTLTTDSPCTGKPRPAIAQPSAPDRQPAKAKRAGHGDCHGQQMIQVRAIQNPDFSS